MLGIDGLLGTSADYPNIVFAQEVTLCLKEIGILWPNNQRQHRTLHIQKDVLPYALC